MQSQQIAAVDPFLLKGAAPTSTQHGQYVSIPEQFEGVSQELMNLPVREAFVKLHDEKAVKVKMLSVKDPNPPAGALRDVLAYYQAHVQRSKEAAEQAIAAIVPPAGRAATQLQQPFTLFSASTRPGEMEPNQNVVVQ